MISSPPIAAVTGIHTVRGDLGVGIGEGFTSTVVVPAATGVGAGVGEPPEPAFADVVWDGL